MVHTIRGALEVWACDEEVECVVYESAPRGGKAFCAGGDVRAVYEAGKGPFVEGDRGKGFGAPGCVTADFFRAEYQMNFAVASFGKPQVAVWDGIVMGGGVGLTAHGQFRVATERALLAMPEAAIGLFPDVGMTHVLPRLQQLTTASGGGGPVAAGSVGRYLGLTGARLSGAGADLAWSGLATHRLHSSQLPALHEGLANPGLEAEAVGMLLDRLAISAKPLLAAAAASDPPRHPEPGPLALRAAALGRCFGPQHGSVAAIVAALQAEAAGEGAGAGADGAGASADDAAWAAATLVLLAKGSPTSLKVTLQCMALNGAPNVTLGAALVREFGLGQRCLRPHADFYEGVRSVLVDKGQGAPPAWHPAALADVDDAAVERFFAPLEPANALQLPRRKRINAAPTNTTTFFHA